MRPRIGSAAAGDLRATRQPTTAADGGSAPGGTAPILVTILALPLIAGLWLTVVVEILSGLHILGSRPAWGLCWAATAAAGTVAIPRLHRWLNGGTPARLSPSPGWAVTLVGGILLLTFLVAVVAPPDNWDSMTYHNARVMEWWDHGDLAYWYTSIDRQLRMPPLASYFKLALYGLTSSDILFNLVQWAFFTLSIVAASSLAGCVSPDGRASPTAAVLVATLPMAILQSTSTQNDLVVAGYWLVGAFFLLRAFDESAPSPTANLLLGCSAVGLSGLSKGTGLLFTGPMWLLALGAALQRACLSKGTERRAWLRAAVLGAALPILVNVGHWRRNQARFGSPTAGGDEVVRPAAYLSAGPSRGLKLVASQLIRNSALQLDSLRFLGVSSEQVVQLVGRLHNRMGISLDEPALAFYSVGFSSIRQQYLTNESTAGCTWHFLLAFGAMALVCLNGRVRSQRLVVWGLALGAVGWIGLCMAVKWMPWNQRLQLPVLIWLMVPTSGAIAAARLPRRLIRAGAVFLAVAALPALLFNATRPLAPWSLLSADAREMLEPGQPFQATSILAESRWYNYFRGQPAVRPAVESVIAALPGTCGPSSAVGLRIGGDSWEYALWIGAHHFGRQLRFRHVPPGPLPVDVCAVVRSDCEGGGAFCIDVVRPGG